MHPLILDMIQLENLRQYAEAHPFSKTDVIDMSIHARPVPGQLPEYTLYQHLNFKIVFAIEEHPSGMFRHLSVSIQQPGKRVPSPEAVQEIMKALGFTTKLEECHVFWEDEKAINIMERYSELTENA